MKLEIELTDESIEAIASAIAEKINAGGGVEAVAEEADDFGGGGGADEKPKEITLTDMQDAIKEAVGKLGKEKVKAFVKKAAGVDKVVDIPKEKYQTVLDGLKKVK